MSAFKFGLATLLFAVPWGPSPQPASPGVSTDKLAVASDTQWDQDGPPAAPR